MSKHDNPFLADLGKSTFSQDPLVQYVMDHSLRPTPEEKALTAATIEKYPRTLTRMIGAPEVLQLNSNLIKLIGGKKIIDVGTFTGASALSYALAIPDDGQVFTFDITDKYLEEVGRTYWKKAGVDGKINVVLGKAEETLPKLLEEGMSKSFDFAFIDASKLLLLTYYEFCLQLVRSGGVIAIDNTIWSGRVIDENDLSDSTVAIKIFNAKLRLDDRINISFLNIADGLTLCFVK